jgi:hypothetical protein
MAGKLTEFGPGNYRYLEGVFQYSAGVLALPGYGMRRVVLHRPMPLAAGFALVADVVRQAGRPLTALCACELRSPSAFSEAGFRAFNESYVASLDRFGLLDGGRNPVARSNVCPRADPPAEPSLYAFCFTVPEDGSAPSFVIAGSAEVPEGRGNYRDHIIRRGDTSPEGMREKCAFVLREMERRMAALGVGWPDTSMTQVYTVREMGSGVVEEIEACGAGRAGVTWHICTPPVVDLDFELDCRAVSMELRYS